MEWDHDNGIWKGSKAGSVDALPDPLYIFGYGSLMWRPGDVLGTFDSYACTCRGWARLFAQRSMDHRGTAAFPGFVATLVAVDHLSSVGLDVPLTPTDEFIGILFRIPQEDAVTVIEELDYREKGGYHRHLIDVTVLQDTPDYSANTPFSALVYTGPLDNPNFCLLDNSLRGGSLVAGAGVAEVVAAAWGPSGANAEYLIHLAKYIRNKGLHDSYLFSLLYEVAQRMTGLHLYHIMTEQKHEADRLTPLPQEITNTRQNSTAEVNGKDGDAISVVGWGSNEAGQISRRLDKVLLGAATSVVPGDITSITSAPTDTLPLLPQVHAGGATSALLFGGVVHLWGDATGDSAGSVTSIENIVGCALGQSHVILLHASGRIITIGENSHDQCIISGSAVTSSASLALANMKHFPDATSARDALNTQTETIFCPLAIKRSVICLAAGLRHSAIVLESGELITWGDATHSQCTAEPSWKPFGARVVHVACGAKHTVCVDNTGKMWSFGDNKYRQLGVLATAKRCAVPTEVEVGEGILTNVFWSRVMCGWSHNVCRGVTLNGEVIFGCWGRSDMGQLPIECDKKRIASADVAGVRRLTGVPSGHLIQEVWCGSEFTIAATRIVDGGYLWATGWGEHLNLGAGNDERRNSLEWTPVVSKNHDEKREMQQATLQYVWPEAVAAGGAHCLAITKMRIRDLCAVEW